MEKYLELLNLVEKYIKTKAWTFIDASCYLRIQLNTKVNVFVSILGGANIDYGINIYLNEEEFMKQMFLNKDSEEQMQPDYLQRLSLIKIDLFDGKMLRNHDYTGKAFEYNIDSDSIALRFLEGKVTRLVNDEECELCIKTLEALLQIIEFYQDELLDDSDLAFNQCFNFDMRRGLKYSIYTFSRTNVKPVKVRKVPQSIMNKALSLPREGNFALGMFYAPNYIEEDVPYYPIICILLDLDHQCVADYLMLPLDKQPYYPKEICQSFIKMGKLPEYLCLANYTTIDYCASFLTDLMVTGEIMMVEEFCNIYNFLKGEMIEESVFN